MEFKDMENKVKDFNKLLEKRSTNWGSSNSELIESLARTVKIAEEVGELNDEVLRYYNFTRPEKKYVKGNLEKEAADVLVTLISLTTHLELDLEKAFEEKINQIIEREESYHK
jgi:NTP pyrophosphatase (non-canonical NTP hydrolase)